MKLQRVVVVAALFLGLSIPDSRAAPELEGLFKGKTISFVVGYGPGTGNDLGCESFKDISAGTCPDSRRSFRSTGPAPHAWRC